MRSKPEIVLSDDLRSAETRFHKIICLLTAIHSYGHHHKQDHAKEESHQEFLQYVPVDRFHPLRSNRIWAERQSDYFGFALL